MRAPSHPAAGMAGALLLLAALAGAALLWVAAGGIAPVLLPALLFWLGLAVGSAVLLHVNALTGGQWGIAARPVLVAAALTTPLPALLFLVVLADPSFYGWAEPGALADRPDVERLYLNAGWFLLRGAVVLWVVIAAAGILNRRSQALAALALLVYGLTVTMAAIDWVMSIDPEWTSTVIGALLGVSQVASAFALAVLGQGVRRRPEAVEDLAFLLLTACLGVVYLGFMQYLVMWSGGLPVKHAWYLARGSVGWIAVLLGALGLVGVLPFLACLVPRIRRSPVAMAGLGALGLVGLLLHLAGLTLPSTAPETGPRPLAAIALPLAFAESAADG